MFTILKDFSNKLVVNRSRFLGYIFLCSSEEERDKILKKIKSEHISATHICYASSIFSSFLQYFCTDDREPSGTAGVQILNVLKESNLVNVLCVVVRYFGGVKLGVQNLSKAYKQCASELVTKGNLTNVELKTKCIINCDYNQFNKLNKVFDVKNAKTKFDDNIEIEVMLSDEEIVLAKKVSTSLICTSEKGYV